jgi:GAF domain-containing protein/GNAT superfamily N-acetyltransferase
VEGGVSTIKPDVARLRAPAVEHADSSQAWLRHALEEIVTQIHRLLDLTGCAFQVVDWKERQIRVAAAWFESDIVRDSFGSVLSRPYEPERAGLTEASIEQGGPLLLTDFESWPGAQRMRARLEERLAPETAQLVWDWYRTSSFMACPVRTPGGRILGALMVASSAPHRPLQEQDLHVIEIFADLAGLALERSERLADEGARAEEERALNLASQEVGRSLELEEVYRAIVSQAARLTGAPKVMLRRFEPAAAELRTVASLGFSDRIARSHLPLAEGMIGRVARTGKPYLSREADRDSFTRWIVDTEGLASFAHVPITIGPRLFGVLTVADTRPHAVDRATLRRLRAFVLAAAAAILNALDHQRERRVAHALTRGYVPGPPPRLPDFDVGLVYEPAGQEAGGGDFFGLWRLESGALAVLIGDVSGKGRENAGLSAMVRFFVEARTWDCSSPGEVLAQTNALVRPRMATEAFVPVFLAFVEDDRIRWANGGHTPPRLVSVSGEQLELGNTGLPLGVEQDGRYGVEETSFGLDDLLFAFTDGLSEARREGELFGDSRLAALLAEHAHRLEPEALVHLVHRRAEEFAPNVQDDVAILALRRRCPGGQIEIRREDPDSPAARELFARYMELVRSRLGQDFEPTEAIFASEEVFAGPGAAWLVLYEGGRPVGCGGLRMLDEGTAEIKRMFVLATARGRGHGRVLVEELERIARENGARRVRLLSTEVLAEARALYQSAGYRVISPYREDGRQDYWLEKYLVADED